MKTVLTSILIFLTTFSFGQHLEPEGRIITFETPDGKWGRAYTVDANPDSDEYVLLFTDGGGLSMHIKKMADRFAEDIGDIHVYVVDIYDAKQAGNKQEMRALEGALLASRADAVVQGVMNFVGNRAEIGLVGYGSGAKWALEAGMMPNKNIKAIVLFNGIPGVDPDELVRINSDILTVMAMPENEMDTDRLNKLKSVMNENNKAFTVETFNVNYDQSGSDFKDSPLENAYERMYIFLQRRLN